MIDFEVKEFDIELGFDFRLIRLFFIEPQNNLSKACIFLRPEYTSASRGYEDPVNNRLVVLQPFSAFSDYTALLNSPNVKLTGSWLSYLNRELVKFVLQTEIPSYGPGQTRPEPLAFPPS